MDDAAIAKNLHPGEIALWSTRPDPWLFARPTFILYIIAVPWTVFVFFWLETLTGGFHLPQPTVPPIPSWTPWVALITGLILLAAGLLMLSGPYWIWRRGKNTLHVITNQRAMVLDTARPNKSQFLTLQGKIQFRITESEDAVSDINVVSESGQGLLFRAVRNPKEVVAQLQNTERS